ncbi:MAG TPA: hypothetical protein PLN93_11325 [Vicinamibacterales bacterium]|nr:hypothetical protein [Vicinamibacterales bacterium]HOG29323.1 hypothetical protein [Vicinamibacterales bacterium]HPK72520.1 hypothetical protein [Vicinamibacterales bacterium]HPW19713.1 hypothetical protein [Vicinamibacterales bacterium]
MPRALWGAALVAAVSFVSACSDKTTPIKVVESSPSAPSGPSTGTATLAAPVPDAPVDNVQLTTLRPTLSVRNVPSTQAGGAKLYEFQIADNPSFSADSGASSLYYPVAVTKTGVAEDASGKTGFTVDADLQPATRLYWRARVAQGTAVSDWSATATFRTRIAGYSRAGELYDPLVNGETVGERVGATAFVPGDGLRLDSSSSYVRYRLPQAVSAGEFSMEVKGLRPNNPIAQGFSSNKPKIFGMQDGDGDYTTNLWRIDAQYRGLEGNPPNCIHFRAMFGGNQFKIEPDTAVRYSMVFLLDPAKAYFWKGSWSNGFRLEVFDGLGGAKLYDQSLPVSNAYNPPRHVAYLGAPVGSGGEMSVIAGTTYRNVWLGARAKPASLGSALER